jgi:uncharacterized protein (DUF983 family)
MVSPFDRLPPKVESVPAHEIDGPIAPPVLPSSGVEAIIRGARGACPRCSQAKLFFRFLKPVGQCPHCRQDWTPQQADDFPAYVSILITGHLMAPVIIALVRDAQLPLGGLVAIILPLAIILMIVLLQPAKGAIIALQWWFGMHGFTRERQEAVDNGP